MSFLNRFFKQGQNNSLTVLNNGSFSYNGPWIQLYDNTVMDRWYVGDFSAAEYTIFTDLDTDRKELVKVLVVATVDTASVSIYSRNNTLQDLISIDATVNSSYVDVLVSPTADDSGIPSSGSKVIFTAQYFYTQNPPIVE